MPSLRRAMIGLVPILVILPTLAIGQETVVDTLYGNLDMEGLLVFSTHFGTVSLYSYGTRDAGDAYDAIWGGYRICRSYFGYVLPEIPDSLNLQSADLYLYQSGSVGNERPGEYPVWDVPGGDTLFCIADHVDIGAFLDIDDWYAGDPGNPATLSTNIGVVSDDETLEWKILDVTENVERDIDEGRLQSQFRIRFPLDTDEDHLVDKLFFTSSWPYQHNPMLILEFEIISQVPKPSRPPIPSEDNILIFPNPFNGTTQIAVQQQSPGQGLLTVCTVTGELINRLFDGFLLPGEYHFCWDGKDANSNVLSAGVYFIIWRSCGNMTIQKVVFCK